MLMNAFPQLSVKSGMQPLKTLIRKELHPIQRKRALTTATFLSKERTSLTTPIF